MTTLSLNTLRELQMAEAHIIGQLLDGRLTGFPDTIPIFVETSFTLAFDGDENAVSQLLFGSYTTRSTACIGDEDYAWNHPLAFHVGLKSACVAPRLHFRLIGQKDIELARGSCAIVLKPGLQKYTCLIARPELSRSDQLSLSFLHELDHVARTPSISCGFINFELNVVTRNFATNGLQT
jgi:hypothetical protein